jgi:hypothetical protein
MEHTVKVKSKDESKGMGERPGLVQYLLTHRPGLVRIAQVPQSQGSYEPTTDPGVISIEGYMGAALLGVIEGHPRLAVLSSLSKLSKPIQRLSMHHMGP